MQTDTTHIDTETDTDADAGLPRAALADVNRTAIAVAIRTGPHLLDWDEYNDAAPERIPDDVVGEAVA